jgi:regulator of protease activity HflC (stomatin/prohibitin superfamily)
MVKNLVISGVTILFLLLIIFKCTERIDAGYAGVKVKLYGDDKGIDQSVLVTGMVFYNPITETVVEFPTFVQHKDYKESSFVVTTNDGTEFRISPIINYRVEKNHVPFIYGKYRKTLPEIEDGFLKTTIFEIYRQITNQYTSDALIVKRAEYENKVSALVRTVLGKEGFILEQFTANIGYPESLRQSIIAKTTAIQNAQTINNRIASARAEADIKVATAKGDAESMLTRARAEAEANKLKQQSLTPLLIQQQAIEAWKSGGAQVPSTILGSSNTFVPLDLKRK